MAALPYLKLFVGDYFADTRHLSCLQHGAYFQLICHYWTNGGPLPNDDAYLRRVVGLGPREWPKMKPVILAFFRVEGTLLVHNRLERELQAAEAKSLQSKDAAQASVERRRSGRLTRHSHSHSHDQFSSSPSATNKTDTTPAQSTGEGLLFQEDEIPPDGELGDQYTATFEAWWAEYPNKVGKGKAAAAYAAAFKRLGGQKNGPSRVHSRLRFALQAQCRLWKRKGVEGKYIPHAATWLNQSRYDDDTVVKEAAKNDRPTLAVADEAEYLQPPDPKPERKATVRRRSGWTPDDDDGER